MNRRAVTAVSGAVHVNDQAIVPIATAGRRALLMMLGATVLWPVLELTGARLMPRHHALQVVFLRYAAHLTLLLAVLLPLRGTRALRTGRPALQLVRGALMFVMPVCYVLASDFGSGPWIWSVFWVMPALTLLGAALLLRERPRTAAWAAVVVGPVGAALIHGAAGGNPIGTIMAMGMAAAFAAYLVLSRVLREEPLGASLFYTSLGAVMPMALIVWRVWTPLVPVDVVPTIALGMVSVIVLGMLDLTLEAVPAAAAVPLLTLVPVWEAVAMIPLRNELPGTRGIAGIAVIVLGVSLLLLTRRRGTVATINAPQSP